VFSTLARGKVRTTELLARARFYPDEDEVEFSVLEMIPSTICRTESLGDAPCPVCPALWTRWWPP